MSGFVLAHQNVRYGGEVQVKPPSDPRLSTITEDLISEIVASAFRVSDRSWRRRTTDPGKHWCCWRLALPGSRSPLERLAAIVCVCGAAHREPGRRRVDSGSGALAHQMQRAMGAPDAPHPAASPSAHADSKRGC